MSASRTDRELAVLGFTDPVLHRIGVCLDEWSRASSGWGYDESENGAAWRTVDAEAVARAGPDPDAILVALEDSAFAADCSRRGSDEWLRKLAEISEGEAK